MKKGIAAIVVGVGALTVGAVVAPGPAGAIPNSDLSAAAATRTVTKTVTRTKTTTITTTTTTTRTTTVTVTASGTQPASAVGGAIRGGSGGPVVAERPN